MSVRSFQVLARVESCHPSERQPVSPCAAYDADVADAAPEVSVVLPTYNGADHLQEAIDSVLSQEGVDLELIIVDDASTDDSAAIAASCRDPRVHVVRLIENGGLASALNHGIANCSATLIARQDQDDVSAPLRLLRQLELLTAQPDVVLVGTWASIVTLDDRGRWVQTGEHRHPTDDAHLRLRLLWNNPFVHSSVVFRRQAALDVGGYGMDPVASWPEDYDLWSHLADVGALANVPEFLLVYRQSPGGMSESFRQRIGDGVVRIARRNLAAALPAPVPSDVIDGAVRSLNSMPVSRAGIQRTAHRASAFWKAARVTTSGRPTSTLRARIRWTSKLVVRSLWPTRDSLGD